MDSLLDGDVSKCLETLDSRELMLLSPSEQSYHNLNLACCQFLLGFNRKALKSCDEALRLCKSNLRAYVLSGKIHLALKKGIHGGGDKAREKWLAGLSASRACSSGEADVATTVELALLLQNIQASDARVSSCDEPDGAQLLESAPDACASLMFWEGAAPSTTAPAPSRVSKAIKGDVGSAVFTDSGGASSPLSPPPPPPPSTTSSSSSLPSSVEIPQVYTHPSSDDIRHSRQSTPSAFSDRAVPSQLEALYTGLVGDAPDKVSPALLLQVRSGLSHATGNYLIDDLIAVGYLQVNTGMLDEASALFKHLLTYDPRLVAAQLALGSCLAMMGRLEDACQCFTHAIEVDPTIADVWKRRGQTRAARGLHTLALSDFNRALELDADGSDKATTTTTKDGLRSKTRDADTLVQRGVLYKDIRDFRRALDDFDAARQCGEDDATIFNYIGICRGQLGDCHLSIAAYEKSVSLNGAFLEAQLNLAQMHKEMGRVEMSLAAFAKAQMLVANNPIFKEVMSPLDRVVTVETLASITKDNYGLLSATMVELTQKVLLGISKGTIGAKGDPSKVKMPSQRDRALNEAASVFAYRSLLYYSMGHYLHSFYDMWVAVHFRSDELQYLTHLAACLMATGHFKSAGRLFDAILTMCDRQHHCFFLREVMHAMWKEPHRSPQCSSLDCRVRAHLKDGTCKKGRTKKLVIRRRHKNQSSKGRGGAGNDDDDDDDVDVDDDDDKAGEYSISDLGWTSSWPRMENLNEGTSACMAILVSAVPCVSTVVQLNCHGFISNTRQHRQFGLAVLHAASLLRDEARELAKMNKTSSSFPVGSMARRERHASRISASQGVDGWARSRSRSGSESGSEELLLSNAEALWRWRRMMTKIAAWRQISEPNDPVWWIDGMPDATFKEGYGLQTPLVNGQLKTIRYYRYCRRGFRMLLGLLLKDTFYYNVASQKTVLNERQLEQLKALQVADAALPPYVCTNGAMQKDESDVEVDLAALFAVIGEDFYAITPLYQVDTPRGPLGASTPLPRRPLTWACEGTRLTLQARVPDGFEFTIRTPGLSDRYEVCSVEMELVYEHLLESLEYAVGGGWRTEPLVMEESSSSSSSSSSPSSSSSSFPRSPPFECVLDAALRCFHLWVNFAPLSRGTAATGYALLQAAVVAAGCQTTTTTTTGARDETVVTGVLGQLPPGIQLDWEAIFQPDVESFIREAKGWLVVDRVKRDTTATPRKEDGPAILADRGVDGLRDHLEQGTATYRKMYETLLWDGTGIDQRG